jgi:hypothetical protein
MSKPDALFMILAPGLGRKMIRCLFKNSVNHFAPANLEYLEPSGIFVFHANANSNGNIFTSPINNPRHVSDAIFR